MVRVRQEFLRRAEYEKLEVELRGLLEFVVVVDRLGMGFQTATGRGLLVTLPVGSLGYSAVLRCTDWGRADSGKSDIYCSRGDRESLVELRCQRSAKDRCSPEGRLIVLRRTKLWLCSTTNWYSKTLLGFPLLLPVSSFYYCLDLAGVASEVLPKGGKLDESDFLQTPAEVMEVVAAVFGDEDG